MPSRDLMRSPDHELPRDISPKHECGPDCYMTPTEVPARQSWGAFRAQRKRDAGLDHDC